MLAIGTRRRVRVGAISSLVAGGLMRSAIRFVIVLLLAICVVKTIAAQITSNPIPTPIAKRGLQVEIKDLVRLPDTRGIRPADQDVSPAGWARVSYVRDLPDGRRFANDSRGFLYLIDANNQPQVYANVARAVSACRLQPAGERIHRVRRFIRSSRETACSTPCTPSAVRAIQRRPTSSRPGSR